MKGERGDNLDANVARLDELRRLRNARILGWGLAACALPTVFSNLLVDEASISMRLVPTITVLLLAGAGWAAHIGKLKLAVIGILAAGTYAMLAGAITHPQLWSSPYGLGLLVIAASTIASPRGVIATMAIALLALGIMGAVAWDVPQEGAPVLFTVVTAGVMLVMAALIGVLQLRTGLAMLKDALERERRAFEAERQVDALQLRLTEAQKMETLAQLAGGIAHDFNNYLQVIGTSGSLAHDSLPEGHRVRRDLEPALTATSHASELTAQLLAFSRRRDTPDEVSDVGKSLESLTKLMGTLVGRSIDVNVDAEPRQFYVKLAASRLEQVMMNLVVNARDAMPKGGSLDIRVRREDGWVVLTIADTGAGMTEEIKAQIFDAFFTTKLPGKGTGLGLCTCLRIVEQSGGSIEVESELDRGTTFVVRLVEAEQPAEGRRERDPSLGMQVS